MSASVPQGVVRGGVGGAGLGSSWNPAEESIRAQSEFIPFARDYDIFSPALPTSVDDLIRDMGAATPGERGVVLAPTDTGELDNFLLDFVNRRNLWANAAGD